MSRWPWRRRGRGGASADEPARAGMGPAPAEPGAAAGPDAGLPADPLGAISPARLDAALERLRERTPARDDGPER